MTLSYADRAERYLTQRGIPYDQHVISIDRMTPRQRRRALKKEASQWRRQVWGPVAGPDAWEPKHG